MPEGINLVSGRGRGRFVVDNTPPALIKQMIGQQGRNNLIAKATSLLPDSATLTDTLLQKDLTPADAARYKGTLDRLTTKYMSSFQDDPYYAFTKEGKDLVKKMSMVVNDPNLKLLEENKKANDAAYEKAVENRSINNVSVSNGRINVIRDGKRQSVVEKDPQDQVLTVGDEFRMLNEVTGATTKYSPNVRSLDDVRKRVRDAFTALGDTKYKNYVSGPLEDIIRSGSSNLQQISAVENYLINEGGLSQEDFDTLMSDYYTKVYNGMIDGDFSYESGMKAALSSITSYAEGRKSVESGETRQKANALKIREAQASLDKGNTTDLNTLALNGMFGSNIESWKSPNGEEVVQRNFNLPQEVIQNSFKSYRDPEKGVITPSRKLSDLKYYQATNRDMVFAADSSDSGKGYFKLPSSVYDYAVVGNEAPKLSKEFVDPNGQPIPPDKLLEIQEAIRRKKIPKDLRKYITITREINENGELENKAKLQSGIFVVSNVYIPKNDQTEKIAEKLDSAGYGTVSDQEELDYYNQHSGNKDSDLGDGFLGMFSDELYRIKMRSPLTSPQAGRYATGEDVRAQLEDTHIDTMGYNDMGKEIDYSFLDDNAIGNQAKLSNFSTKSDFK